jgi:hypothetical protein
VGLVVFARSRWDLRAFACKTGFKVFGVGIAVGFILSGDLCVPRPGIGLWSVGYLWTLRTNFCADGTPERLRLGPATRRPEVAEEKVGFWNTEK